MRAAAYGDADVSGTLTAVFTALGIAEAEAASLAATMPAMPFVPTTTGDAFPEFAEEEGAIDVSDQAVEDFWAILRVRARNAPSPSAATVGTFAPGEHFRGVRDGRWIAVRSPVNLGTFVLAGYDDGEQVVREDAPVK